MPESTLYAQARATWPKLDVTQAEFERCLAAHAAPVSDAAELYLACACAAGMADAIKAFEARYFTCIAAVARRLGLGADDAQEIAQTLRQRLFVATDGPPKVVDYAGRGQLPGLVQVAATRVALNLKRGRKRLVDEDSADVQDTPRAAGSDSGKATGADTTYAKAEYREHVRTAIEVAAAALSTRDRTLLRLHLVEHASIDDIATVYRVHRATAARWIVSARELLVATTRVRFLAATQLEKHDSEGLASFVESQLTLSLDRILR